MVGGRHMSHNLANEAATLTATQLLSSPPPPPPATTSTATATARTSSVNERITPAPLQSNTPQLPQPMLSSQIPHSQNATSATATPAQQ